MIKKYNINFALDDVISIKNETIARITKKGLNELFYDAIFGEEEIKRTNGWEKILINNNLKRRNIILKKNKKISVWNTSGEIIKIYSVGNYKVKILNDENNFLKLEKSIILILFYSKNLIIKFGKN